MERDSENDGTDTEETLCPSLFPEKVSAKKGSEKQAKSIKKAKKLRKKQKGERKRSEIG